MHIPKLYISIVLLSMKSCSEHISLPGRSWSLKSELCIQQLFVTENDIMDLSLLPASTRMLQMFLLSQCYIYAIFIGFVKFVAWLLIMIRGCIFRQQVMIDAEFHLFHLFCSVDLIQ